jgi:hypothetical protein
VGSGLPVPPSHAGRVGSTEIEGQSWIRSFALRTLLICIHFDLHYKFHLPSYNKCHRLNFICRTFLFMGYYSQSYRPLYDPRDLHLYLKRDRRGCEPSPKAIYSISSYVSSLSSTLRSFLLAIMTCWLLDALFF